MKHTFLLFSGILFFLYSNQICQAQALNAELADLNITSSRQTAITRAVEKVGSAVVGINVTQGYYAQHHPFIDDPFFRHFFRESPQYQKVKSLGSGFLISNKGFILTNQHVVKDAIEILVTLAGGKQYPAEKIGEDFTTDIAVLKIKGDNFSTVQLGDSDDIIIGEWAIALGNPFGLFDVSQNATVTVGVISAKDQDFGLQNNKRIFDDMIQTDAAINSGNSGGPLVNSLGQVIGINTWIISGSESISASIGLGFAIPINRVKRILDELINYGHVDRSYWTGISYDNLTPSVARYLNLKSAYGVIITDVQQKSPAAKAGLKIYDVILSINDNEIVATRGIEELMDSSDLKSDDVLAIQVIRNRNVYTKRVRLEQHPKNNNRAKR
jgi:serine protease Do